LATRKNWELILGTVGPLFFSFLPKTDYWRGLLGTLGDALRTDEIGMALPNSTKLGV